MEEFDFRFGKIAQLYYEIANQKVPCQMDLLDEWFPGLMILTDSSDGNTKTPAEYQELSYVIHAVKYHGRLYSGGSTRVSQILGRLIGTASGNREKERKTAELMQKHAADCFATDMELTPSLQEIQRNGWKSFLMRCWICKPSTACDWQNGVRPTDPVRFVCTICCFHLKSKSKKSRYFGKMYLSRTQKAKEAALHVHHNHHFS